MKKRVHIVVQGGLVQAVYTEDTDAEVVIYDLDTDNNEEYDELISALTEVRKSGANRAY